MLSNEKQDQLEIALARRPHYRNGMIISMTLTTPLVIHVFFVSTTVPIKIITIICMALLLLVNLHYIIGYYSTSNLVSRLQRESINNDDTCREFSRQITFLGMADEIEGEEE